MIKPSILIVDDKADVRLSLRFLLTNHQFNTLEASSLGEADVLLSEQPVDLILLDMNYQFDTTSGEEGLAFIKKMKAVNSPPIIAMTAWSSVQLAVQAMQNGACDFFAKPWDNQTVISMVKKQLALVELSHQLPNTQSDVDTELLWHSELMQTLQRKIQRIARTDAAVLLRGENGTGKTSIAQYIHACSNVTGPFVSVNVAAIPESLFESELFGHKKGAFTDAKENRVGRFEAAHNGTLLLDEVGSLGLEQQAKLLRVLESNEFERVGDNVTKVATCRIICASNANFEQLIADGQFRTDLYFRINPIELEIPALNFRKEEVLPLAHHFLAVHSKKYGVATPHLSENAEQALMSYHWPGNIRELSHFMARATLMCETSSLDDSDFAFKPITQSNQELPLMTLEDAERKLLLMAMSQSNNNVEHAALLLGISKSAIYRRLDKYNIKTK